MRLSNSFGFALFLLLLREKHGVFLLICLFLLITKVFIKFKRILFGKHIRLCSFKDTYTLHYMSCTFINANLLYLPSHSYVYEIDLQHSIIYTKLMIPIVVKEINHFC